MVDVCTSRDPKGTEYKGPHTKGFAEQELVGEKQRVVGRGEKSTKELPLR